MGLIHVGDHIDIFVSGTTDDEAWTTEIRRKEPPIEIAP